VSTESKSSEYSRPSLRVQDVVKLHLVYDHQPGAWLHTHGLVKYGYPELEIRDIPIFLAEDGAHILNGVSQYMLDGKGSIKPGEIMQLGNRVLCFEEAQAMIPDEESHYEVERLRVVDPPLPPCMCDVCEAKRIEEEDGDS